MKQRVVDFLRPTAIGLMLLGAIVLAIEAYLWRATGQREIRPAMYQWANEVYPTPQPSAKWLPADVVRNQLNALSDPNRAHGILQCWAFASPSNRAATGPPERFGKMILEPPYDVLSHAEDAIIGDPVFIDGRARVFISLLHDQRPRTFVWVLSKQQQAPWTDCWMTDAVFAVGDDVESETERDSLPERPVRKEA